MALYLVILALIPQNKMVSGEKTSPCCWNRAYTTCPVSCSIPILARGFFHCCTPYKSVAHSGSSLHITIWSSILYQAGLLLLKNLWLPMLTLLKTLQFSQWISTFLVCSLKHKHKCLNFTARIFIFRHAIFDETQFPLETIHLFFSSFGLHLQFFWIYSLIFYHSNYSNYFQ